MVETRDRQKACSYNRPLVGQAGEGRNLINEIARWQKSGSTQAIGQIVVGAKI